MDEINERLRNIGGIAPSGDTARGSTGNAGSDNPVPSGSPTGTGERNAQPNAVGTESGTSDGVRIVDPGNDSGGNAPGGDAPYGYTADGRPRAKPGRKPGSGTAGPRTASAPSGRTKTAAKSTDGLERLLYSVHMMAAAKFAPELAIDKPEAQMLARAITDVQEHYGFDVGPEATLWINLVTALGTVYGPRAVAITMRRRKQKKESGPQPQTQQKTASKEQAQPDPAWKPIIIPGMH